MSEPDPGGRFPTTHWSRIALAGNIGEPGEDARKALADLCEAYWYPVYAFIRRKGNDPEAALDLTQAYFARLLEGATLRLADPGKGRFRSLLMADCSHFLADQHDREQALKRGGGRSFVSIDAQDAEGRFLNEPVHQETAERRFERDWALALIARTFDRLDRHYTSTGRSELFQRLKSLVLPGSDPVPQATIAAELGMTEGNVRVAAHRLRGRFASELREEVAATIDDPDPSAVDDELRSLLEVLGP